MKKRILSMLLVLVMVFSLIPMNAMALPFGTATESDTSCKDCDNAPYVPAATLGLHFQKCNTCKNEFGSAQCTPNALGMCTDCGAVVTHTCNSDGVKINQNNTHQYVCTLCGAEQGDMERHTFVWTSINAKEHDKFCKCGATEKNKRGNHKDTSKVDGKCDYCGFDLEKHECDFDAGIVSDGKGKHTIKCACGKSQEIGCLDNSGDGKCDSCGYQKYEHKCNFETVTPAASEEEVRTHKLSCSCGKYMTFDCSDRNGDNICDSCKEAIYVHVCKGGKWTSDNKGNHSSYCYCGKLMDGPYPCEATTGIACYMCGYDLHKCGSKTEAVVNKDGLAHSVFCLECDKNLGTESHKWENSVCTECGAKSALSTDPNKPENDNNDSDDDADTDEEVACDHRMRWFVGYEGATCQEASYIKYSKVCLDCGYETNVTKFHFGKPASHDFSVTVEAQAPTCIEGGWAEYQKCSVCGEEQEHFVSTPDADAHHYVKGTCEYCGESVFGTSSDNAAAEEECEAVLAHKFLKPGQKCACCDFVGQEDSDDDTTDAEEECEAILAHKFLKPGQKCACCDFVGPEASDDAEEECEAILAHKWLKPGQKCACCDFVGPEKDPCKETGHNWIQKPIENYSCDKAVTEKYECDKCGETEEHVRPAGQHNFVNGKCDKCGAVEPVDTEEECEAILAHKFLKPGQKCACCDFVGPEKDPCKETGHNWIQKPIENYSCDKAVTEKYECDKCGEIEENVRPAGQHNFVNGKCDKCGAVEPVDTEEECEAILAHKFLKPGQKCACCDFVGPEKDPCKETGHNWIQKPIENYSCDKAVTEKYECDKCGETEEHVRPAGQHNFVKGKCDKCGAAEPTEDAAPTTPTTPSVPSNNKVNFRDVYIVGGTAY